MILKRILSAENNDSDQRGKKVLCLWLESHIDSTLVVLACAQTAAADQCLQTTVSKHTQNIWKNQESICTIQNLQLVADITE